MIAFAPNRNQTDFEVAGESESTIRRLTHDEDEEANMPNSSRHFKIALFPSFRSFSISLIRKRKDAHRSKCRTHHL